MSVLSTPQYLSTSVLARKKFGAEAGHCDQDWRWIGLVEDYIILGLAPTTNNLTVIHLRLIAITI